MAARLYLGVDVGTGSARAGIFDGQGRRLGMGTHPLQIWSEHGEHYEQSSEDVWHACAQAVKGALQEAQVDANSIAGIGFDATCSLVALDAADRPVTVSSSGDDARNVILWMDHRALAEAARINETGHEVLRYVGGVISPEMQTPKLLWLKAHLPASWRRAARFFDLPAYLTYRATGSDVRSLCSTTCKWTYLAARDPGPGWQSDFFREVGLGALADEGFRRIGTQVRPMGERIAGLTERAAHDLGLRPGIAVAVSIIDAHAGGLGLLGAVVDGQPPDSSTLERRVALIGGTSSCHMAVSREPRYPGGIWGPYYSAMIPGLWLTEGGQSATGALIDHVIDSHASSAGLRAEAEHTGTSAYALLNARLERMSEQQQQPLPALLTRDLHVMPDFHGNRSPRADPTLRGMISGLDLTTGPDALALLYLATIQAIAYGTRHIIETMNSSGYAIDTVLACGGDTKNPVFVREHADITGCRVVLPREPEAVLLGAAILGAVASGDRASVLEAMTAMDEAAAEIQPASGELRTYHDRKYRVFQRMHDDQLVYRDLMNG